MIYINRFIEEEDLRRAEQVLADNGIEEDEAKVVLQAIGYTLLNIELYPEKKNTSRW